VTGDTPYKIVRALSASRLVGGALVLLAGIAEWWALAAAVFIGSFLTDMVDGALARRWRVVSWAGARLDTNADVFLTASGLLAVTIKGGWPWWLAAVLTAAYACGMWLNRNLQGDLLSLVLLAVPVVNFVLITYIVATFLELAGAMKAATVLVVSVPCWAVLAFIKQHRIGNYLRMVINRSEPGRE
jgi:phosphatidylglycerophosphate synthase